MPRTALLAALSVLACALAPCRGGDAVTSRDALVTFQLDDGLMRAELDVRVLAVEPSRPPPTADGPGPRRAFASAPFVAVTRGKRRGEVQVANVPPGEVVVLVLARPRAAAAERPRRDAEATVLWRALEARPGARHDLGRLRPQADVATLQHAVVTEGRGGAVDVAPLALRHFRALACQLVPLVPEGEPAPVMRLDLAAGSALRLRGARVGSLVIPAALGPEDLAPGWLLGPESRTTSPTLVAITCRVTRSEPCTLRVTGAPPRTVEVHVWARREGPDGAFLTATADALRDTEETAEFIGELDLAPGPWQVLARAVDADGCSTGATALVSAELAGRPGAWTVPLAAAASLVVRAPPRQWGASVTVRPVGWTVDLAAGALGRDGTLHLAGLVPRVAHLVSVGEETRRIQAPGPGEGREVVFR